MNILIHDDDLDGWSGAWVFRQFDPDAVIYPEHKDFGKTYELMEGLEDEAHNIMLWFIDICPPRELLLKLKSMFLDVYVIDHHQTNKDNCGDIDGVDIETDRCGAYRAWMHFFPDKPVPKYIEYVDDGDRWQFQLPMSRSILTALWSYEKTPETIKWLRHLMVSPYGLNHLDIEGKAISRQKAEHVEAIMKKVQWVTTIVDGVEYKLLGVANSAVLQSYIGDVISKQACLALIWNYSGETGQYHFSVRASEENPLALNAQEFAAKFGGGGHKYAAGFRVDHFDPKNLVEMILDSKI